MIMLIDEEQQKEKQKIPDLILKPGQLFLKTIKPLVIQYY